MHKNISVNQVEVTLVDLKERSKSVTKQIEVYQADDEIERLQAELAIG